MLDYLRTKVRAVGAKMTGGSRAAVHQRVCYRSDFIWRHIMNRTASIEYRLGQPPLTDIQAKLLARLNHDGIAVSSVDKLIRDSSLFDKLADAVRRCELSTPEKIHEIRSGKERTRTRKDYVIQFLGNRPVLEPTGVFLRFGLQPEILNIVNSYFGMLAKLRSANVWQNIVTHGPPRESQLWHRDWEDRHVLKLFVYLTDVDEGSGPFAYAAGTHPKGTVTGAPSDHLGDERRCTDEQLAQVVPKEKWIIATGPKGTIILADTMGYHKGGFARQRDRILYNCMYTSGASLCAPQFICSSPVDASVDRAAAFALEN